MKLKGRKALVTGANRSIGHAIAKRFAKEGADVAITYRSDETGAKETARCIENNGMKTFCFHADFSSQDGVYRCFEEVIREFGSIDILVNNAGGYDTSEFMNIDPKVFASVIEVSLIAPMILTQLMAKQCRGQNNKGVVINIASVSGLKPHPNQVAHGTAKAGLIMLTKLTALELAPHGIRVNALAPGSTPYEGESWGVESVPLGVEGKPEWQADGAVYLASDDSKWVTGQTLTIDGGHMLT